MLEGKAAKKLTSKSYAYLHKQMISTMKKIKWWREDGISNWVKAWGSLNR